MECPVLTERMCYGMPGTERAYVLWNHRRGDGPPARADDPPVQASARYAPMPPRGTDAGYCALCGTALAYAAMGYLPFAALESDIATLPDVRMVLGDSTMQCPVLTQHYRPTPSLCDVRSLPNTTVLCSRNAVSGTDTFFVLR
eukprot:2849645-Rhodomonas_salina.1